MWRFWVPVAIHKSPGRVQGKVQAEFPLLSDPDFKMIEAYGARRMKTFLANRSRNRRSSFLIGADGKSSTSGTTSKQKATPPKYSRWPPQIPAREGRR